MKATRKKPVGEPPLPSRYARSRTGTTYFYVIHTSRRRITCRCGHVMEFTPRERPRRCSCGADLRQHRGLKLYRIRYLVWDVVDRCHLWTAQELVDSRCRWLKRKPTKATLEAAKAWRPS